MANISVYHNNAVTDSTVSATNVDAFSSASYLSDERISFKFFRGQSAICADNRVDNRAVLLLLRRYEFCL